MTRGFGFHPVYILATCFTVLLCGQRIVSAAPAGKWFDHILIMLFENHSESEVIADANFAKYANLGRALENYFAITHPSQPNYFSLVAGDFFGHNSDTPIDLPDTNIVDLLEAQGLTWKSYMESYPGGCDASKSIGNYYRKHNPLISFDNVRLNATRCANIVGLDALDADLANGTLPNYMFLSPNILNDGHDTSVAYAGSWLDQFFSTRLLKFPRNTLIVVTWDEDDYTEANQVLTFMLDPNGSIFPAGTVDNAKYDHFSLLRTVEDNWNLGNLGRNDATASPIVFPPTHLRSPVHRPSPSTAAPTEPAHCANGDCRRVIIH